MGVRLIAGRAGTGKTHGCLATIADELRRSLIEGPRLLFLVPEQAAMQMERALLAGTGRGVLGRCEVISFRRLAHRIIADAEGSIPLPLTTLGREMALRYLIGRHRRELREFSHVCDRGGFLSAICRGIAELLQESVTVEQITESAARAEAESHPSAARFHDLALLYRAYLNYLGDQRVDPESVLDLARERLDGMAWLRGAGIWIDGFAGFTEQQLR
ncbi:MAG TPA: hypothetical protein VMV81_07700, partial [Phycisphaerae bacterium]|nr:hypothetical protein [Phycisphaerae bacterium]